MAALNMKRTYFLMADSILVENKLETYEGYRFYFYQKCY